MHKDFYLRLIATAKAKSIERFVVGAVITNKKNETLPQALKREVLEETNLKLKKICSYISSFDYFSSSKKKTRQFNFHIEVQEPFEIKLSEHDSFAWLGPKNISNNNITKELVASISKFA